MSFLLSLTALIASFDKMMTQTDKMRGASKEAIEHMPVWKSNSSMSFFDLSPT